MEKTHFGILQHTYNHHQTIQIPLWKWCSKPTFLNVKYILCYLFVCFLKKNCLIQDKETYENKTKHPFLSSGDPERSYMCAAGSCSSPDTQAVGLRTEKHLSLSSGKCLSNVDKPGRAAFSYSSLHDSDDNFEIYTFFLVFCCFSNLIWTIFILTSEMWILYFLSCSYWLCWFQSIKATKPPLMY